MKNTLKDEGTLDGPIAPPGNYSVRLIVRRDTLVRQFTVVADPRVKTTTAELVRQFEAVLKVRDKITEVSEHAVRVEDIQSQLDQRVTQSKELAFAKRVDSAAAPLRKKFEAIRAELYEVGCHVDQCSLDQPMKLYNQLMTINSQIQVGDYPPTKQHLEMFAEWSAKVAEQLRRLQQLEDSELAAFNRLMQELGLPAVFVAPRKTIS
jgi:DNA-binding transcriptional MerR regulator